MQIRTARKIQHLLSVTAEELAFRGRPRKNPYGIRPTEYLKDGATPKYSTPTLIDVLAKKHGVSKYVANIAKVCLVQAIAGSYVINGKAGAYAGVEDLRLLDSDISDTREIVRALRHTVKQIDRFA